METTPVARGLQKELRRLSGQIQILHHTIRDLMANVGHHDHWDPKGTFGANCWVCIRQRQAKERARAVLQAMEAGNGE